MCKVPAVIHWFRLDLRLHDNLALRNAINEAENRKYILRPTYFLNPESITDVGHNRLRFLIQSLRDLDTNLQCCKAPDFECQDYDVPSIEEMGFDESTLSECKYPGGEMMGTGVRVVYKHASDCSLIRQP
ncbi:unnamed protein product, partial [Iphiclides podalirius]